MLEPGRAVSPLRKVAEARTSTEATGLRAAPYLHMSTEHQRYSTENQAQAISDYADANGIEIVRTCEDAGKSGLTLKGRPGLQALPRDVQEPGRNFDLILVYDVSRWGRFPDPDEAASYVYACKHQGVTIIYCAEPFQNDGSLPSAIMIGLKRGMAAEYSRELSTKVFRGACTIVQHGFRQGGSAGYGLRRQLLDGQHTPKGILDRGYWNKSWPHFRQIPALYRKGLVLPVFNLRSSKPTLEPAF